MNVIAAPLLGHDRDPRKKVPESVWKWLTAIFFAGWVGALSGQLVIPRNIVTSDQLATHILDERSEAQRRDLDLHDLKQKVDQIAVSVSFLSGEDRAARNFQQQGQQPGGQR